MKMNVLVNFTQYTKVVRLVYGYNPLRNASGRKSDFFFFWSNGIVGADVLAVSTYFLALGDAEDDTSHVEN